MNYKSNNFRFQIKALPLLRLHAQKHEYKVKADTSETGNRKNNASCYSYCTSK